MDDKRTLDELIAELNEMRGRMDILRRLANAMIYSHPEPQRLADEWFRVSAAGDAAATLDPAVQDEHEDIAARIRQGSGEPDGT